MDAITINEDSYQVNSTGRKVLLKDLTAYSGQDKYKLKNNGAIFYHKWDNDKDRSNPLCILRLDEKGSKTGLEVTYAELGEQFDKI